MPDDEPHAPGLLALRLLLETCHLNCNPGSLHQRLVRASDNTDVNVAKMQQAKRDCLHGCTFAAMPGVQPVAAASRALDVPSSGLKDMREVLGSGEKRAHIKRLEGAVARVKDSCFVRCTALCAEFQHAVDKRGRKRFQAYDAEACAQNCCSGCKLFTDHLEYSD